MFPLFHFTFTTFSFVFNRCPAGFCLPVMTPPKLCLIFRSVLLVEAFNFEPNFVGCAFYPEAPWSTEILKSVSFPPQKPASSTAKKVAVKSGQPLASTPEKASRPQPADLHRTPAPSDRNNSARETPRQRAHNILIDKVR